MAFSVLQAAKRNGGGAFVAFVVAGGGGKVRLHRRSRCVTQYRKSPLHSVWPCQSRRCLASESVPNGIPCPPEQVFAREPRFRCRLPFRVAAFSLFHALAGLFTFVIPCSCVSEVPFGRFWLGRFVNAWVP